MFGSNFIELGIALSFLFVLLSLMCSLLGESTSKYLSWRAEMLEESIRQLLRDRELADDFYKHPMIKSLARGVRPFDKRRRLVALAGERWPRSWAKWLNEKLDLVAKPSYIKSTIFARVILDVIVLMPRLGRIDNVRASIPEPGAFGEAGDRDALLRQLQEAEFDTDDGFKERITRINACVLERGEDAEGQEGLLKCVEGLREELPPSGGPVDQAAGAAPKDLAAIRAAIAKLKNTEARKIFQLLVGSEDVKNRSHAEAIVARYYDDVQERVSGWYKRKSQRWVFAIGLALALILNANTFIIADKLLRDNTIRGLVVAAAQGGGERFKPRSAPAPEAAASAAPAGAPSVAPDVVPSGAPAGAPPADPGAAGGGPTLQELKQEIEKLSLPIGWPERPLLVASPVISSVAACALDAELGLQAATNPAPAKLSQTTPNARKARDDLDKRAEQSLKDARAIAEFESNPRGCPDFVCGDRKWGAQWPYYAKKSALWFLKMIVGWLVTALGAALGAQFWFDVLGNIMHIRASKKPDDAPAAK